jgi:WD40 repeat protein
MIAKLINCVAEKTNAHSDTIRSVAFSPDGTKIVSGSDDGTIKVRREPSKSPLLGQNRTLLACLAVKLEQLSEKTNAHSNQITSVAFSPDGTKIVSGSWDRTIKVWDSDGLELLSEKTNAHSSYVTSVAFSPDGTKIVSGSAEGTIEVWDSGALGLLSEKTNARSTPVYSVAFSPDGTKIVSGSWDRTIEVWDSGAPSPQDRPSLAKTDAFWLVWQARWGC